MASQVQPSIGTNACVVLALGGNQPSNKGNPRETVEWAVVNLSQRVGSPIRKSRLYKTPAFPAGAGPDFVNAVVAFETNLSPEIILALCHEIEADAQRSREKRWGQRTLDIDLIGFGEHVCPDLPTFVFWKELPLDRQMEDAPAQLILPHPRMQDRSFVLIPMMDVACDWLHPVLGMSTRQLLARRPADEKASVCLLDMA